ncbi:MAG: hypothetical protein COB41_00210 [Proteobacteria bacterium]|nr:MAG: hypothetical protein COB41_00210 [Pseudomonadota bacterium]
MFKLEEFIVYYENTQEMAVIKAYYFDSGHVSYVMDLGHIQINVIRANDHIQEAFVYIDKL